MVTYCVTKMINTCSQWLGSFDTTIVTIVVSSDKEWFYMTHQNLSHLTQRDTPRYIVDKNKSSLIHSLGHRISNIIE